MGGSARDRPKGWTDPIAPILGTTDLTGGEAADIAGCFLHAFVPAQHLVWFASSLAVANVEQKSWPLPS